MKKGILKRVWILIPDRGHGSTAAENCACSRQLQLLYKDLCS